MEINHIGIQKNNVLYCIFRHTTNIFVIFVFIETDLNLPLQVLTHKSVTHGHRHIEFYLHSIDFNNLQLTEVLQFKLETFQITEGQTFQRMKLAAHHMCKNHNIEQSFLSCISGATVN